MHLSCQQSRMSWLEVKNATRNHDSLIHPVACAGYKELRSPAHHTGTWIFLKNSFILTVENIFETAALFTGFWMKHKAKDIQRKKRIKLEWSRNYRSCGLAPKSINFVFLKQICKIHPKVKLNRNRMELILIYLKSTFSLTFRWLWDLFLRTSFQKMALVYILTKVVAIEWALADSTANPFVLVFSIISGYHCKLSWPGWLIVKTAKMNSSTISQSDFPAMYWPSPSYICYSVCKAVSVIKHLLGTCYQQGLYENPLKLETNSPWPVRILKKYVGRGKPFIRLIHILMNIAVRKMSTQIAHSKNCLWCD